MAEQNSPQPGGDPAPPQPPAAPSYGAPDPNAAVPPPGAPMAPPGAPGVPPAKKRTGKIIGIVVGVLAVLAVLCAVGVFFFLRNATSPLVDAKVDQCFAGDDIATKPTNPKLEIVDCGAGNARYKIVGKLDNKTLADANNAQTLCQPFIDKGAETSFWQEERANSDKGPLFCLAPAK